MPSAHMHIPNRHCILPNAPSSCHPRANQLPDMTQPVGATVAPRGRFRSMRARRREEAAALGDGDDVRDEDVRDEEGRSGRRVRCRYAAPERQRQRQRQSGISKGGGRAPRVSHLLKIPTPCEPHPAVEHIAVSSSCPPPFCRGGRGRRTEATCTIIHHRALAAGAPLCRMAQGARGAVEEG